MAVEVFGAGKTSDNPVKMMAACSDEYAMIPYIIKTTENGVCGDETVTYTNYTQEVALSPIGCVDHEDSCKKPSRRKIGSGNFPHDGVRVYYEVYCEPEPCPQNECETGCSIGNYWINNDNGELSVSYEKYTFRDCTDITRKVITTPVECSDTGDITVDTGCKVITFPYKCSQVNPCESGTTVVVRGVTFSPVTVDYSGGTINASVSYEKVIVDENCNEYRSRGSLITEVEVSGCSAYTTDCCEDHTIEIEITKNDILSVIGISDATLVYKNNEVSAVTISMVQKADPSPDCKKNCEYKVTYCVLEGNYDEWSGITHEIKVGYETYWGSNVWSGTSISAYGGRAKISFDYIATAEPLANSGVCKPYTFKGSDSVIIQVSPCESSSSEALTGEIYYKDRSNDCRETEHVKSATLIDPITSASVITNKITYNVVQDCSGVCEKGTYIVYDTGQTVNAGECDTTVFGSVPYSSITVSGNCEQTVVTGTTGVTVQIDMNQTNSARTFETDYFTVYQAKGPCMSADSCNCNTAVQKVTGDFSDDGGEQCSNPERVYENITVSCSEHTSVDVPYNTVCNGVVVGSGTERMSVYVECNSGATREVFEDEFVITQLGGCDCGGGGGGCDIDSINITQILPATITVDYTPIGTYSTDCSGEPNITGPGTGEVTFCGLSAADGVISAKVTLANTASTSSRSANYYLVFGDERKQFTVRQAGSQPGPIETCEDVEDNQDLNRYIVPFNEVLREKNRDINIAYDGNNKCIYSYLSYAYESISDDVRTASTSAYTVSWMLANAMAEITPYSGLATSYFTKCAESFGGNQIAVNENQNIYDARIKGGFEYAKFKNSDYSGTNNYARLAREQLRTFDVGSGSLVSISEFDSNNPNFVLLDRLIPDEPPSNEFGSKDYEDIQDLIRDYPTGTTQAIADKDSDNEYICREVLGLSYSSCSSHEEFLRYGSNLTGQATGYVKWREQFARWRPGAFQKLAQDNHLFTGSTVTRTSGVYINDTTGRWPWDYISFTNTCGACGDCGGKCGCDDKYDLCDKCNDLPECTVYTATDDCIEASEVMYNKNDYCPGANNGNQSYPSGHSSKAYFLFLMCVESDGIANKEERVLQYCRNRNIVRAHWKSDVIVGKYLASTQIGFMNGVQQFHDKMP